MSFWGKWNATWHFISTLFCWCLSAVETPIEQLHEAWDVQSCLFDLKLVVKRKEWSCSLALCSAQVCRAGTGADRGRSSQCLCWVYTSTFLNRPRSGSPRRLYSDLSCHIKDCQNAIYYLNFLKKNKNIVSLRYTCVPNRKTCIETVRYKYVYHYTPNIYIYIKNILNYYDSIIFYPLGQLFSYIYFFKVSISICISVTVTFTFISEVKTKTVLGDETGSEFVLRLVWLF